MWVLITVSSVRQFRSSVMSGSSRPHGLQHIRLSCPSPTSSWCLLKLMSIKLAMPSNHLILSSPSPPAFNLSQHQWVSSSHQVVKVLEFQLQHLYFQWTFRTDFLQDWLVGSPCSPRDSQESFPTPQFKCINSSVLSFLYNPTLTSKASTSQIFVDKVMPLIFNMLSRLVIHGIFQMATHSSFLAWRIPGMAEPGGLPSVVSHRVGHDWSDLAVAAVDATKTQSNQKLLIKKEEIWTQTTYRERAMWTRRQR